VPYCLRSLFVSFLFRIIKQLGCSKRTSSGASGSSSISKGMRSCLRLWQHLCAACAVSWCHLHHSARCTMVPSLSQCQLQHSACTVPAVPWCHLHHSASCNTVHAQCQLYHGAIFITVPAVPWCHLHHSASCSMVPSKLGWSYRRCHSTTSMRMLVQ